VNKLTEKQERVLEFIHGYLTQHQRGPFIREIQQGCGIASYKSVVDRLNALEHKGFIKRTPNKHRSIKLSAKGQSWRAGASAAPAEPVPVVPISPVTQVVPLPVAPAVPLSASSNAPGISDAPRISDTPVLPRVMEPGAPSIA
jgi:repressor LexA